MFDLNELPEGDGLFTATTGKSEGEGIQAAPAEGFVGKEDSNKYVGQLLRDGEEAQIQEGSALKKTHVPPAKPSTAAYPEENWEAEKLAEYDASNRGAKSSIALGGTAEIEQGRETRLLDKTEATSETDSGFGTSIRPEKLGQGTTSPTKKPSDLTTYFFNRSPEMLDVPTVDSRLGDTAEEDDGNMQSRLPSVQSTGPGTVRKGKRARDNDLLGLQATADPAGPSSKRQPRSGQTGAIVEVDRAIEPSLYMSVERDVTELVTSPANNRKSRGKGELSIPEEPATSLCLGDRSLIAESSILGNMKSVLGLSISASAGSSVNKETGSAMSSGDKKVVSGEAIAGKTAKDVNVLLQAPEIVSPNQPFWRGQLRGDGFGSIDVAAYCSEEILPTSQLRGLPQVLTVEKISRLPELFEAVRQGPIDDPVIRIKHPPSTNMKGETFACLFQPPRSRKQGTLLASGNQVELHLGLRNGSADQDMGPPGFTHNDDQYVAIVKLKDSKVSSSGRRSSKVLYLVLDTVAEAACDTDVPFRKKFEREIIEYGNIEESILYAILCHPPDRDRSTEAGPTDELTPEVVIVAGSRDSSQIAQPDAPSGKVVVIPEKRSSSIAEIPGVEPTDRDSHGSLARSELQKSIDNKETPVDSSHELRRSEKNKVRKDEVSKERQKERERERERDRESRGKEREREGRSVAKDGHRHTHRSSEKGKESDTVKRDRSKDKDADRLKEKERDRRRELVERSKRVKEVEREKQDKQREKEREKLRDREKEKDRERSLRKRDRSAAELERVTGDEKNLIPDTERPAPGFGPPAPGFSPPPPGFYREGSSGLGAATLLGKDIRRRGKIVDEDVAFDEKLGFEFKTTQPERDISVSKKTGHSSKTNILDRIEARVSKDDATRASRKEASSDVARPIVKTTDAQSGLLDVTSVNATATKELTVSSEVNKDKLTPDRLLVASASDSILQLASEDARNIQVTLKTKTGNLGLSEGSKVVGPSVLGEMATTSRKVTEEAMDVDVDTRILDNVQGRKKPDTLKVQATEIRSSISKSDILSVANVATSSKVLSTGRVNGLDAGKQEGATPVDSSGNDGVNAKSVNKTRETLLPPRAKVSLSVRVENMLEPPSARKYDGSKGGQELEPSPAPIEKPIQAGAEDALPTQLAGQYSPTAIDNGSVTPIAIVEKDVSLDFVLSACDKETRAWLVSRPNEVYLAEEFGVRILRIEEIPSAKIDLRPRIQQGPVNVRLSLATDKSTDANEARWLINQAADMLRAVASRGVFAKCLWYQGPVQRLGGDLGPSIQAVVKKIKGDDGKNLERIQEVTGVMIGIVLDANNKKGIVNSSRVIGLRLKCIRKRGFVEATRQAEELLGQVAELFSKDIGAGSAGPQDVGQSKLLKLDSFSTASPSSGIVTPLLKDVYASYSPVSPVTASTPLASGKSKLDESPIEVQTFSACATAVPSAPHPGSGVKANPPTSEEINVQSPQNISEDEESDRVLKHSDSKSGGSRPLYVSSLPSFASAPMLKQLFEEVLKKKYDGSSELVFDINLDQGNRCALVEFASDELLRVIMKAYAEDSKTFCGLKLELGSSAALKQYRTGKTEVSGSAVELGSGPPEPLGLSGARKERTLRRTDESAGRFAGSTDSDCEVFPPQERRYSSGRLSGRSVDRPRPLFLTELMRNASAKSIHDLFEEIIKKYGYPALGSFKGRPTVMDVRYIPSRGSAFIDLATSELVDFMLDLHTRKPEVFFDMKMEVGRRPLPGQADDEEEIQPPSIAKRLSAPNRYPYVPDETIQSYSSSVKRPRRYFSPPRRDHEHEYVDEYDEEEEEERLQNGARKRRSDPERTVYADRLPENATEGMIRRIFETVLRDNLSEEQRERMGDDLITEVRHVPTKFCAFIVFGREELTRLVLQLYNQDEDIFENMRLKPHFHSRMEDLYREELHERDDGGTYRLPPRDCSLMDRRRLRGMDEYYHSSPSDVHDLRRGRVPTAHRAVAATAFKEVDRRRSVYVDRISEHLPEPKMREMFERALRQNRHPLNAHLVSQVTFFRDKFDKDKLCAFVELENEELVQQLLEVYTEDEESFKGSTPNHGGAVAHAGVAARNWFTLRLFRRLLTRSSPEFLQTFGVIRQFITFYRPNHFDCVHRNF
ncbi:hypothetical protein R1flu_014771 [Riccia fluitans]|uniref:RRM domain-containing protein n=1 Tax=Riccia fluitans TaxID=41844 RepID=A0ABD1YHW6_9MARC